MNKHVFFLFVTCCFSVFCKSQNNQLDEQGRRNGPWKVYFDGTSKPKFEGNYIHGKKSGTFKFYKKGFYDHPSAIMEFKDEKDTVTVTYYTQQGKPISQGKMLDQKREGKWIYFHQETDSTMMVEYYKNDQLHGLQKTYFPNGNLAEKTEYTLGLKNGESLIYTEKGKVARKLHYKNGKLHGFVSYYSKKGEKIMEGHYSEGEKTGQWKYYKNGELEKEEDF
ncbi:MAG: aspartic peptidase [Gramella sp.]|nr:aspartic peptidase [Christiangramia sp.]